VTVAAPARPVDTPAGQPLRGSPAASDARAAQAALRERILGMEKAGSASAVQLSALEQIRVAAETLHPQLAKVYTAQPIPLEREERQVWQETVDLWLALHGGYARVLEAGAGDVSNLVSAHACHRALHCMGRAMLEHVCVYRAVPAALWKQFNGLYLYAETRQLRDLAVDNSGTDPATAATCGSVYRSVLLALAANTYALSPDQINVALAWARDWNALVALAPKAAQDAARSPHAIDLAAGSGPIRLRQAPAVPTLRYVDAERLAQRLRDIASALREGRAAPELAIATQLSHAATEKLLTHLYVQWCSAGTNRAEERRPTTQRAQVSINFHSIHFQISGRAFRQPGLRYTRDEERDIATFGHITERTESRLLTTRSSALEPWEIVNQGATGALGMNRRPDLQTRVGQGQLVAMRVSSTQPPMLGMVQRIREEEDGSLGIGVRIVPVVVQAASVRPPGNPKEKFERALLIPADEERKQAASLVLIPGTYRQNALLEVATLQTCTVRLLSLVEKGANFERVAFEPH
jgi:hypothetical protein